MSGIQQTICLRSRVIPAVLLQPCGVEIGSDACDLDTSHLQVHDGHDVAGYQFRARSNFERSASKNGIDE